MLQVAFSGIKALFWAFPVPIITTSMIPAPIIENRNNMTFRLTTYLLIALLFASQSFAVNGMSCFVMQVSQGDALSAQQLSRGAYDTHATEAPCMMQMGDEMLSTTGDSSTAMNSDCCDDNTGESCNCPVAACGVLALMSAQSVFASNLSEDKISSILSSSQSPFHSKAKRPPIHG